MKVNNPSSRNRSLAGSSAGRASTNTRHTDQSARRLIEFAVIWAPYGGASSEDVLVNFGMTSSRFVECLWQIVEEVDCAPETIEMLTHAYPRSSHAHHVEADESSL